MFRFKCKRILNLTDAVFLKTTFERIFESYDDVLCFKEIHRLGPIDLKNLYPSKKPVTLARQLTRSNRFLPKLSL